MTESLLCPTGPIYGIIYGGSDHLKESISVGLSDPMGAEGMGMPRRNKSSLAGMRLLVRVSLRYCLPGSCSTCVHHRGVSSLSVVVTRDSLGAARLFSFGLSLSPAALPSYACKDAEVEARCCAVLERLPESVFSARP